MLDNKELGEKNNRKLNVKLIWTNSKVALIELLYALNSVAIFNNSNAYIKDIADHLEHVFEIDLGDYYRTFLELRMQKTS